MKKWKKNKQKRVERRKKIVAFFKPFFDIFFKKVSEKIINKMEKK